jgi:lipopolysaccharide export system protein LptA
LEKVIEHINKIKAPVFFAGSFAIMFFFLSLSTVQAQKKSKIEILGANTFEMDDKIGKGAKRLIGDVRLKHEDALMFCDSAYVYSKTNTMDAYGHVRITQGDSLQLFGDSLKYNGNTKKAILRGNIRLINNDITLTTQFLDFDRTENVAYYYGGGKMVTQKDNNTLTSKEGYFYTISNTLNFKDSVLLVNPKYQIEADTLGYSTAAEMVSFLGPTTITSDDNLIYTEDGWYNTVNNKSKFYKNAFIYSDNKIIKGDTLFYERDIGFGEILCNGTITDTVENMILQGDLIRVFEQQDSVMITEEAMMMQIAEEDTFYMHADTFFVSTQYAFHLDSLTNKIDSSLTDTLRSMLAYNNAKFYKNDMQGKADSVVYIFSDSTINFYNDPIIWSQDNQLTADFVYIQLADGKPQSIFMEQHAFVVSKADSLNDNFNQIKGRNMIAHIKNEELHKIDVKENSETITYAIDDDGKYIGVNKLEGEDMLIRFVEGEIQSVTFIKEPKGEMNPVQDLSPKDAILKGFSWRIDERPTSMFDIFIK